MTDRTSLGLLGCGLALSMPCVAAESPSNYPSRPIRMLVPNAPGSSVDTLSRIIGNKIEAAADKRGEDHAEGY